MRNFLRDLWPPFRAIVAILVVLQLSLSGLLALGAQIERRYFPFREPGEILQVTREAGRLCYKWTSVKYRAAPGFNVDVFIRTPDNTYLAFPYNRETNEPWSTRFSVSTNTSNERSYCVPLSLHLAYDTPIKMDWVIYYRGLFGLWTIAYDLPPVMWKWEADTVQAPYSR